jgi:hypothetical protein
LLGRKNYTQEELDHATTAIDRQLAAYKKLAKASDGGTSDPEVRSALDAFEPLSFNNMTLVLDRYFVHRLRVVTGKDGNPRGSNVIKLVPDQSVLKLEIGERIKLRAAQVEHLSKAFFDEIRSKFL